MDTPIGDIPDTAPLEQQYYDMLRSSNSDHVFVVLMTTVDLEQAIAVSETAVPVMSNSIMETTNEDTDALPTDTLLLSDTPWNGKPTDTIFPNTLTDTRLIKPFTMERNIPVNPAATRRGTVAFGQVEFANADGAYDEYIRTKTVDGQRVQVYLGPKWGDFGSFKRVGDAFGHRWSAKQDRVRISVRDVAYQLGVQAQQTLYSGQGGYEGDPALTGTTKPLCYGEVYNITPVLLNAGTRVYHVHDGNIQGITTVRDSGAELTFSADYSDLADLSVATIPAGQFATCISMGLFRIGAAPDGDITCDVEGDATRGYSNQLGDIVLNILEQRAGLSSSSVLTSTFLGLPTGAVGYYLATGETKTIDDVLNELLGSINAWYGAGRDRRLRVGNILPPETSSIQHYLESFDILNIDRIETLVAPIYKQGISYNKNWTPLADNAIATSIQGTDREDLTLSSDVYTISASEVALRFTTAQDGGVLPSYFRDQADAEAAAREILDLFAQEREFFQVTVGRLGYEFDIGEVINITWGRFGLEGGRPLLIVGMREDAEKSRVILKVWG
jgi:hypothetical protein